MATFAPFDGWRYDPGANDLQAVTAPPYDVISPAEQDALYARDPKNVVRLILNKGHEADDDADNRYARAAGHLQAWREDGTLYHDRAAVYLIEQEFAFGGERHKRRGFFSRVLLSPLGEGDVYPHERTLAGPKEDRLRLMRACRGNLSPVFGLLAGEDGHVRDALHDLIGWSPTAEITDEDGVITRFWVVDHQDNAARICSAASACQVFIADGHHRYETALNYRNEAREAMKQAGVTPPPLGELPSDWVLMMCVPASDPGLVIGPTHRMVHSVADFDPRRLLDGCAEHFAVEEKAPETLARDLESTEGPPQFGLLVGEQSWSLQLREPEAMDRRASTKPEAWRRLDVAALHTLILEDILGIDEEKLLRKENIVYTRDFDEAVERARNDEEIQCVFLTRSTTMAQVREVCTSGEVMPQKSTYFYPKVPSGLVFHLFD
jgi:uncharacterized protein (DUF1015 family)